MIGFINHSDVDERTAAGKFPAAVRFLYGGK